MVRSRRRKPAKLEHEPKPDTGTGTLPPLLPTPLPKPKQPRPNHPTIQIMQRVWSKFDVIVVMRGIVDYIAEKGVDPMNNLDDFVEFVNKNSSSSSYTGYDCGRITWKLGKNGVDDKKNCNLHLETRNFDDLGKKNEKGCVVGDKDLNLGKNDCGKSVKKTGGGVDDGRVLNLGMNDGGNSKKGSVVDNVSNSGKNDGGSCLGGVSNGKKKGGVSENVSNSGKNDGVSCVSSPSSERKRSCVSNGKKKNVKTTGICGKKGNCKENVGGNKCVSSKKDAENLKLGVDYGGVYSTETQKDMRKRRNRVGGNRWTFGGRIRTTKGLVVGKKSILKGKEDGGGNKQNSNKNARRDDSIIQVKKGGLKNNNGGCANLTDFGCWDKNEVILREAVRRMISRRLSLRDELETDLLWCPPRIGVLKWNTDASVREDDNKAAIGGVLRDWNGSFRCVFSCPLDCCESNEAEVKAIYKALELASCKDWLLNLHMVIESDSMNAVRWCNEDNGGPLNLGYMLNFIRECRRWWPGLEIAYMGRKSNSVADRLSKQGHERSADFVAWM